MKKAFVLVAIAALMVCIIPVMDSSDATGETTVSGYLSGPRDITEGTGTTLSISIIYSADETDGEIIGTVNSVSKWTSTTSANKFVVPIEPKTDRTITHYYLYFNIYGFSISSVPLGFEEKATIDVEGVKYSCYKMNGIPNIVDGDNPIGTSSSGWFSLKIAEGSVTGKVSTKTDEPVYLNGVTVTLYDIDKKNDLKTVTTSNGGEYKMTYSTGMYIIKFDLGGYQTEEVEVVITEETPTVCNVTLKETQNYFGFDLPHALMIIGGTVAVVLLLFTLFVRMRLSKR